MAPEQAKNVESGRLGSCEVCGSPKARYTCPRCEVKTCCIQCVRIHKKELECDGVRNRLFFRRMNQFSNLDLLSDYRLLEDMTRSVQKIKVDTRKTQPKFLRKQSVVLGKTAEQRGMRLHFLPRKFKRAIENSSYYDISSQAIFWRIEWQFPQADVTLVSERIPESMRLAQALCAQLDPDLCHDENVKSKMEFFYSAGVSGVCALLRVGEMENNRYHVLDLDSTVHGNLIHKSIVEFPVITVVLRDHVYGFDIYDSDDEEKHWKGNWENNSLKIKRFDQQSTAQKDKKMSHCERNLLIASDDSADDMS